MKSENMETFEDFVEKVKRNLSEYFGDSIKISVNHVTKNNGLVLTGISITNKESNISPTVYLESYYERYKKGEAYGQLIYELVRFCEDHKKAKKYNMEFFKDYKKAGKRIVYKLINKEKNEALLQHIPFVSFLDMAVVFYYLLENDMFQNASILIYNSHLSMWNITKEQLYEDSKKNTPKLLKAGIVEMKEVMRSALKEDIINRYRMTGAESEDGEFDEQMADEMTEQMISYMFEAKGSIPMYVLTNRNKTFGASCILYEKVLQEFARRLDKNLYILPSSIHEVIIVTEDEIKEPLKLKEMVQEVNATQVAEEEVLSDSVYYFDRREDKIRILCS